MLISTDQLRTTIERVEHLEAEKRNIADDIKQVFAEAKSNGFDVKIIREIIKRRAKDASEIEEEEFILDTYLRALGMIAEVE